MIKVVLGSLGEHLTLLAPMHFRIVESIIDLLILRTATEFRKKFNYSSKISVWDLTFHQRITIFLYLVWIHHKFNKTTYTSSTSTLRSFSDLRFRMLSITLFFNFSGSLSLSELDDPLDDDRERPLIGGGLGSLPIIPVSMSITLSIVESLFSICDCNRNKSDF